MIAATVALPDVFRRHDLTGWAKARWTLFVIVLPLVGVVVYMIARPPMEDRLLVA
jgi:Phospholipase_D-nuclease N-terminal